MRGVCEVRQGRRRKSDTRLLFTVSIGRVNEIVAPAPMTEACYHCGSRGRGPLGRKMGGKDVKERVVGGGCAH